MVNLLVIIGIIYSVFYVFSIGGLVLLFFRKDIKFAKQWNLDRERMVKAIFIMPNMTTQTHYKVHDDKDQFEFESGVYNVDRKAGLFTGRTDTSWSKNILTLMYEYGNPNPIRFKNIKKDETIPYTDAEAQKIAMQQKFIKDLMQEGKKLLLLILMVAGVGLLIVFNLYLSWDGHKILKAQFGGG